MSTKISYRLRGSPSQHTHFHLMTRLFEFRLVTIGGVFVHNVQSALSWRAKRNLFCHFLQVSVVVLLCSVLVTAWLALPGQRHCDNNMRHETGRMWSGICWLQIIPLSLRTLRHGHADYIDTLAKPLVICNILDTLVSNKAYRQTQYL